MVEKKDDALLAEAEEAREAGNNKPAAAANDADRQAQIAANRARMQAMAGKK
jgi:hypothetical protein